MRKKSFNLSILLVCTLLLFACGKNEDNGGDNLVYKTELPKDSPGLEHYIRNYITSDIAYPIVNKDHINIYAIKNLGSQQKTIEYVQFSDEELKQFYNPLFASGETEANLFPLRESRESLYHPVEDKDAFYLPEITMEDGNILHVKTETNEKQFKLPELLEAFDLNENDRVIFNLVTADENSFQIGIQFKRKKGSSEEMTIFMTQDLKNTFVTQPFMDVFAKDINSGDLSPYESLFIELDQHGRYVMAADSSRFVDKENSELKAFNESDLVSKNDEYVYIDGKKDVLSEGKQYIQKTDDYLAGNDTFVAEFDLNFKQISDALDLKSVNDVSIGKVTYFNKDFVVLYLNFKASITGTAGSTNVIVDFQDNKENPTIFLVNLGDD